MHLVPRSTLVNFRAAIRGPVWESELEQQDDGVRLP